MTQSSEKYRPYSKADFPSNVQLVSTTRYFNGTSKVYSDKTGYADFNLATHVGDNAQTVAHNRVQLIQKYHLPSAPTYLEQIHSDICVDAPGFECIGDAMVSGEKNTVCCVMTADCLPIFASNCAGTQVGVAHAGWKGIVNGVIESFVSKFNQQELIIQFGPAISQAHFEVGQDVYDQFVNKKASLEKAFVPFKDKYKLDIYQAARIILNSLGVENISGGHECTYAQSTDYFSYRRDGVQSGRMAHLIWIE